MKNKTIIGARSLSQEEIEQILPTYNKIFEQIDDFRINTNSDDENKHKSNSVAQKTNNIGIMGCRGAGKTSVLKTISKKINSDKPQDIILPIIIPENMSESSTLMATILGLFKTVVDNMVKKNEDTLKNCICGHGDELKQKYNEAIKQYIFIQNDYRNILMNQFTTENEYVKKINQVFNSDIEFINKFNDFIKELIERRKENKNSIEVQPLIIIFIDDIDLSTTRCSDVVKTLLSYLSNENIVTIISGDLDTFEEALTIEFLRQEKALSSEVMKEEYLGNNESLLQRKKVLAYEYLKKVIPPTYRHNIKYWSLSTKASYSIHVQNKETDNKTTLGELLVDVLEKYIEKSFFRYFEYGNEESKEKEYNLPYTYNLFDNTSRGLNNIYNMLKQIQEKQKGKDKEIDYSDRKLLIEAIAASKPLYNSYRTELFENIIQFGDNDESTLIKWDNLAYLLALNKKDFDKEKNDNKSSKVINENNDETNLNENQDKLKEKDKFSMFIFVYFAAKLMKRYDAKAMDFTDLKSKIINILINNPEISESLIKLENKIELKPMIKNKENDSEGYYSFNMLSGFLYKFDFELALHLYKYLSNKDFDLSILDDTYKKSDNSNIKSFNIKNIWFALNSYCKALGGNYTLEKYIAEIYSDFIEEFSYVQSSFSNNEQNYILERTLGEILNDMSTKILIKEMSDKKEKISYKNVEEYSKLIINTINKKFGNKLFNNSKKINEIHQVTYKDFKTVYVEDEEIEERLEVLHEDIESNDNLFQDEYKRYNIINTILKNNLKGQALSYKVYNYISYELEQALMEMYEELQVGEINIDKFKDSSYYKFQKIYKGGYWTIANTTKRDIENILDKKMNIFNYRNLSAKIRSLATNNLVWYGQKEAQNMLEELVNDSYIKNEDTDSEYVFLRLYINYFMLWKYDDEMEMERKEIKKFKDTVSVAQITNNKTAINQYIDIINADNNKIEMNEFELLFSINEVRK